jgi:hypothetical protein
MLPEPCPPFGGGGGGGSGIGIGSAGAGAVATSLSPCGAWPQSAVKSISTAANSNNGFRFVAMVMPP